MSETYAAKAMALDLLSRKIEILTEECERETEAFFNHFRQVFKDYAPNFELESNYKTYLNVEEENYGTKTAARRTWYETANWIRCASAVLSACEYNLGVRIKDENVVFSGCLWETEDQEFFHFEMPLAWLDLDLDGIEAEIARLKEKADAEKAIAEKIIAEADAAKSAEEAKRKESEEYELYKTLKAKYEG